MWKAAAALNHGVITRPELLAAGISEDQLFRLVKRGEIAKVLPNVYRVAGAPRSWLQLAAAASSWVGETGAVSHGSAAAIYELDGYEEAGKIEVVTCGVLRSRGTFEVHRVCDLFEEDLRKVKGIRVTSADRLVLDLAPSLGDTKLEKAAEDVFRRRLTTPAQLLERCRLAVGRPGAARLEALLRSRSEHARSTDSDLEVICLQALRRHGLPDPVRQYRLRTGNQLLGIIDIAYPAARVGIEVDGFKWHGNHISFHRDRARLNAIVAQGWRMLLFSSRTPQGPFARQVADLLDATPWHRNRA